MQPYLSDPDFQLFCGDSREVLSTLPAESVHMAVTSPPFFGLRDYGTGTWEGGDAECDHKAVDGEPRKFTNGRDEGIGDDYAGSNLRSWTTRDGTAYRDTCGKCGARRVDNQIGLESTPEEWVAQLVAVFEEVRRVLRKDGTLWVECGDSYTAGQGGRQSAVGEMPAAPLTIDGGLGTGDAGSWQSGATTKMTPGRGTTNLKPKDLIGQPFLLAFALREAGWYWRNVCPDGLERRYWCPCGCGFELQQQEVWSNPFIWHKPNPMPESVRDRFTVSHSYVLLFSKSPRYFFDAEAVREPHQLAPTSNQGRHREGLDYQRPKPAIREPGKPMTRESLPTVPELHNPAGRNARSVWTIPTEPLPFEHYAAFPQALAERCIKAGTSERGCCPECGAPWVRETETSYESSRKPDEWNNGKPGSDGSGSRDRSMYAKAGVATRISTTLGWRPSCPCHEEGGPGSGFQTLVPCTVLDPFLGSGTTALVSRRLGRRCIGVELNERYCELAAKRTQQLSLEASA